MKTAKTAQTKKLNSIKKKSVNGTEAKKLKKIGKSVELPASTGAKKLIKKPVAKKTKNVAKAGEPTKKTKKSHQEDLEGLKDLDPEFYTFLKQNDKELLEFNLMGSDDSEDESDEANAKDHSADEDGSDNSDDEKFHKPSNKLEVASDESDYEDDEEGDVASGGTEKVTLNLIRQWQLQLEEKHVSIDVVRKVIQAFNAALASMSGDLAENSAPLAYKVVGAATFNGILQLCVLHLQPAILRFLGITPQSNVPLHKTKKWLKLRSCLRYYLTDLINLVERVSSTNMLSVLLKHLHQMSGMVASFSTLSKTILKRLIVPWSTGDESVRVLAFLCILKITRSQQVSMLQHVLKAMYLSYVRNSKFVSPNTLPGINFMRRSLVEMFALDLNVTYQHAFLYIRQLAIHLRNAVILKKKDSFQAVYNWQFVNSVRLWSDLLAATADKPQLQPLIYPLVTIITGVIRLIPTAQYFPLRFHCIQSIITLAKATHTFVPVLPLILEVLRSNTFNRKHTAVSMKPLLFTCVLRLNKTQLAENGFRDEVVEQVCGLTLEYLSHESASLAFTDLVVPLVVALKAYLKKCRNANYSRKLKQLLDKIQENSRLIELERRKVTFGLKDLGQVRAWEAQVRNKGTPLAIYYASWVKTHETKKRRQAAQNDGGSADYDVPMIKRRATTGGVSVKNENGEVELFPSDSEDELLLELPVGEEDEEEPQSSKVKKNKKNKQNKLKASLQVTEDAEVDIPVEEDADDGVDIVKDLDLDDW